MNSFIVFVISSVIVVVWISVLVDSGLSVIVCGLNVMMKMLKFCIVMLICDWCEMVLLCLFLVLWWVCVMISVMMKVRNLIMSVVRFGRVMGLGCIMVVVVW